MLKIIKFQYKPYNYVWYKTIPNNIHHDLTDSSLSPFVMQCLGAVRVKVLHTNTGVSCCVCVCGVCLDRSEAIELIEGSNTSTLQTTDQPFIYWNHVHYPHPAFCYFFVQSHYKADLLVFCQYFVFRLVLVTQMYWLRLHKKQIHVKYDLSKIYFRWNTISKFVIFNP